ncbi:MAG: hypothetical protein AB1796_08570 [Bacillota bacterium]
MMKGKYRFAVLLLSVGLLLSPPAGGNRERAITLAAAGDILLDRGVRAQLKQHGYGENGELPISGTPRAAGNPSPWFFIQGNWCNCSITRQW